MLHVDSWHCCTLLLSVAASASCVSDWQRLLTLTHVAQANTLAHPRCRMNNYAACRQLASDKLTASQAQLAADESAAVLGAGVVNCRYCLLYATELCCKGAAQRHDCAIGRDSGRC
jgi:hypothetical protein